MKKLFTLFLCFSLIFSTTIVQAAQKSNCYIYRFTVSGHRLTRQLEQSWHTPIVQDQAQRYKGVFTFDARRASSKKYYEYYGVYESPQVIIVDGNGKLIKRAKGVATPQQLSNWLSRSEVAYGERQEVDFGATIAIAFGVLFLMWLFGWL